MRKIEVHAFFILKDTGACVYHRNFSRAIDYEINFLTPFFSAIFSFADRVISGKIEVLEISNLRFTFKIVGNFIFTLLSDQKVSLLFLKTRLDKISKVFKEMYPDLESVKDYQEIDNPEFDNEIITILSGQEELFNKRDYYSEIIKLFKDYMFQNEIIGAAALSAEGNIIFTSLPDEILIRSLKELEIRFMTGVVELPESYYALKNGQKVFSKFLTIPEKLSAFLIVLLFEDGVPLGICQLNLNKVAKKIVQIT